MPVKEQSSVNLASLSVHDVYVLVAPPASTSIQGVETGICGIVGSAAWGPLNTPVLLGTPSEVASAFGPLQDAPKDLTTDVLILMQLGVSTIYGVRVSDGTDAKASGVLVTASTGTVTVGGVVNTGDVITVTVDGNPVVYTVSASDTTLDLVAEGVALAINSDALVGNAARAVVNGAVVTVIAKANDNAVTLTAAVTGAGATTTATASGATLAGGGVVIGTFNALYSGEEGNNLDLQLEPGDNTTVAAPTWNLLVSRKGLAPTPEKFVNLPEATLGAAIASALLNGQGPSRGPSKLVRFTVGAGNAAPMNTVLSLTGGANGDTAVTNGQQLGTPLASPATGLYALDGLGCQQIGLAGNVDHTIWPTVLAFGKEIGSLTFGCYPANTSTQDAIAKKKAVGIDDPYMVLVKDWVQFYDSYNGKFRLVSPLPFAMGRTASLTPNQSPGNKPIGLVVATEKTLAEEKYSPAELALLTKSGITLITNQCPGGSFFGLRHGRNSSSNSATDGIEYTRMTNFLAYSLNGGFGEFIEALQTVRPNDKTREDARKKLRVFLSRLEGGEAPMIDAFSVDMGFGPGKINTKESVEQGFMKARVMVRYQSVIRYFVITLIGGKTVEVSVS